MAALNRRRRWPRALGEHGSELIELAIALPILLLVIAGIMDFGFLFERYEVVTNAAREGARMAVLTGYSCDNTLTSDVGSRVQTYLSTSGLTDTPTVNCGTSTQTLPSGLTVQVATVTVTYPSSFLFIGPIAALVGGSSPGTVTLQAVSVMRVEVAGGS
jgi:Flp pilus assembly protein TadG